MKKIFYGIIFYKDIRFKPKNKLKYDSFWALPEEYVGAFWYSKNGDMRNKKSSTMRIRIEILYKKSPFLIIKLLRPILIRL